jgi:hypothetical protein
VVTIDCDPQWKWGRSKHSALVFVVTFIFVGWSYKFVPRLCVTACCISLTNAVIWLVVKLVTFIEAPWD